MAQRPGEQSGKTMNREVRPQWNPNDSRQFSCNDNPYGENYYTVSYDANGNEIPERAVFNPDGPFYQSGASNASHPGSEFLGALATTDAGSVGPLAKQIAQGEVRPHSDDFISQRSVIEVDAGRANRGSDDGYGPNQPSAERDRTHMDFSRGGKR